MLRGRAFACNNVIQFSSVTVVALLSWLLVPRTPFGIDGWRWVMLIAAIGAVCVWWIRRRVPESPRWLARHGRIQEAEHIMDRMEADAIAEGGTLTAADKFARARKHARQLRGDLERPVSAAHHHAFGL